MQFIATSLDQSQVFDSAFDALKFIMTGVTAPVIIEQDDERFHFKMPFEKVAITPLGEGERVVAISETFLTNSGATSCALIVCNSKSFYTHMRAFIHVETGEVTRPAKYLHEENAMDHFRDFCKDWSIEYVTL